MKTLPIVVLCGSLVAMPAWAQNVPSRAEQAQEQIVRVMSSLTPVAQIQAAAGNAQAADQIILSGTPGGHVVHLGAPAGRAFASGAARVPGQPALTARNFLKQNAGMLGAPSAAVDFATKKEKTKRGRNIVRMQQTYGGVPVLAGEVVVQLNAQDDVEAVLSDIARDNLAPLEAGRLALQPRITAAQATEVARRHYAQEPGAGVITATEPALTVFAPEVLDEAGEPALVWDFKVHSEDGHAVAARVLVDAHAGTIVRGWQLGCTALNRRVYDRNNDPDITAILRRDEGDPASGFAQADRAYTHMGEVYNYYMNNHSRDSYDGAGARVEMTVRWCRNGSTCGCPCANAFSGDASSPTTGMVFGNGYVMDDVVAHEFTHRVTAWESGLIYTNASGAINESFSDVWGEFVDLTYNSAGNDAAGVRWDMGEDLSGGRLRSMSDPPAEGDPDRLNSSLYQQPSNTADNGGVHRNSGVNNKLAFLLVDGDTFNGQTVYGLGVARVADLYYEVQTDLLTSGAGYISLGNALRQAAVNLGWNSADQNNLYRACLAVEIVGGVGNYYVDKTSACLFPTGNQNCGAFSGPWKTLSQGVSGIPVGNTLMMHGANYNEPMTIRKIMTIRNYSGTVNLGKP